VSLDPIADMLAGFLERLGLARPDTAARLSTERKKIAGEPWATDTRPAGLSSGELVVEVGNAGTLSVLRYRTGELLARLDDAFGEGTVEVIRLRVAREPF
jgi:hypothetical protein